MSGPKLITLGCRLNIAESEAIRGLLGAEDDLIVVNSCAVTNEAVRQTRQAIRRAKRARPGARIVVTGCAAQIDPAMFAAMPEVARVIGNAEKLAADAYQGEDGVCVSDIMKVRDTAPHLVSGFSGHARAFVEVQTGCDHRCTFCIIPYGRGNSRAAPVERVVERIAGLVDQGYREAVLTGVDLTSHPNLAELIESVLRDVSALPRLRLSSLDPSEVDDRLFDLITGEPRLMPHLHLSLQAGDDMLLKRMKRRHSRAQAVDLVARVKATRPEVAIGADIIAGFPTETDAMFENSLAMIDDCDIVFGHIFPFSPRAGTPAARMPQVDRAVAKERARALRERAAGRQTGWLASLVETRQRMLVELDGVSGHAESFAKIRLSRHPREGGDPFTAKFPDETETMDSRLRGNDGKIVDVKIVSVDRDTLIAEPIA